MYEPAEDTFLVLDALQLDFEQIIYKRFCYGASLSTMCQPLLVVELGSGAGLLSAAVAKILRTENAPFSIGAHCVAVDLNPAACHVTAQTCKLNDVQVCVAINYKKYILKKNTYNYIINNVEICIVFMKHVNYIKSSF